MVKNTADVLFIFFRMKCVPCCLPAGGSGVGVLSMTSKKPKGFATAVPRLLCAQSLPAVRGL